MPLSSGGHLQGTGRPGDCRAWRCHEGPIQGQLLAVSIARPLHSQCLPAMPLGESGKVLESLSPLSITGIPVTGDLLTGVPRILGGSADGLPRPELHRYASYSHSWCDL